MGLQSDFNVHRYIFISSIFQKDNNKYTIYPCLLLPLIFVKIVSVDHETLQQEYNITQDMPLIMMKSSGIDIHISL